MTAEHCHTCGHRELDHGRARSGGLHPPQYGPCFVRDCSCPRYRPPAAYRDLDHFDRLQDERAEKWGETGEKPDITAYLKEV